MSALALVVLFAAAEYHYIIPIVGNTQGIIGDSHFASGTMLNPTARTATVQRTGLFPAHCTMPESWQLAPRTSAGIAFPFNTPCKGMAAVSIVSNEPLYVTGTIQSFSFGPDIIADVQHYDAPTAWIEAGVEAVTEAVAHEHSARANLLVVNPNQEPLRVEVHLERPEYGASRDDAFDVPPATIRLFRIAHVEDPSPPGFPKVVMGRHTLVLRANGRFWAGVSSLDSDGGNTFRKAIPLEP